mmetsp:Transcript_21142/g.48531  ORF Transcript_21142/g.48531 Transcript_21142/m.48531 type:complete len:502 (-) Transcript_21142:253-1758(-)
MVIGDIALPMKEEAATQPEEARGTTATEADKVSTARDAPADDLQGSGKATEPDATATEASAATVAPTATEPDATATAAADPALALKPQNKVTAVKLQAKTEALTQGSMAAGSEAAAEDDDEDDEEEEVDIEEELRQLFGEEDEADAARGASTAQPAATVEDASAATPPKGAAPKHATQRTQQEESRENPHLDEHRSRFMKDDEGNVYLKWKADYAARGGGGRAQCRDLQCLERIQQMGVKTIEKGCLRIGRRVLMPGKEGEARNLTTMWYHARCIFNTFKRARQKTRCIEASEDIEGFDQLNPEDQRLLQQIIAGSVDVRNAAFGEGVTQPRSPQKRGVGATNGLTPEPPAKRGRLDTIPQDRTLNVGQRIWTHCKVRPPETPEGMRSDGMVSVKSKKTELGMVRDIDLGAGVVLVQFESREAEQERLEKLGLRKFQKIRSWLTYPRTFEGKKQKVPLKWIDWQRKPPRLCSCTRQEWGHDCETGISCSRGVKRTVWGVCQ